MGHYNKIHFTDKRGRDIVLRAATSADAEQVLAYNRSIFQEAPYLLTTLEEFTITAEDERRWIEDIQQDPDSLILIAIYEGEVAGFLDFQRGHRRRIAHTGSFSINIRRDLRGGGLGTRMLQELITWATARPELEKIWLQVFATNQPAISLYESQGFVQDSLMEKQIKLENGEYVDLVGMGLLLPPKTGEENKG
ncbi:GNAT family N-acetyltransferase [Paenibacillus sp. NFR01]|uniref:GNAT family N-acetyltransferase n=1 Tax=Paenibacillus sp. NFR01 TaxID=1566279 RepID=UPI0008CC1642|nr:GNAT family N-acetyltransferase [Paenibacillus sp. NFR01]SET12235.1 L-amino acid N-acyltransferase YncA [Paenibacillus sp. NFR01]